MPLLKCFFHTFAFLWICAFPAGAATPAQIKEVAQEMVCLCGDCNRESLATCVCSAFAVPERDRIGRLLDEGKTPQQIIDQYVATYGQLVLATPPAEGYNLLAWIAPFAALIFGIVLVRSVLLGWRGRRQATASPQPSRPPAVLDEYQERLRRELENFDR
jgi:cytochrome c-type biogenesis protein CcmH